MIIDVDFVVVEEKVEGLKNNKEEKIMKNNLFKSVLVKGKEAALSLWGKIKGVGRFIIQKEVLIGAASSFLAAGVTSSFASTAGWGALIAASVLAAIQLIMAKKRRKMEWAKFLESILKGALVAYLFPAVYLVGYMMALVTLAFFAMPFNFLFL